MPYYYLGNILIINYSINIYYNYTYLLYFAIYNKDFNLDLRKKGVQCKILIKRYTLDLNQRYSRQFV